MNDYYPELEREEQFLGSFWDQITGTPKGQVDRKSRSFAKWVQQSLNKVMGLRLAIDGDIGRMTKSAIRDFQRRQGLTVDGIVGSNTERALIAAGAGRPPEASSSTSPARPATDKKIPVPASGSLGTLTVIEPAEYRFRYTFTPDDSLWLARLIVGEAGGHNNLDNHAVIWALFNRFALFTHRGSMWMRRAGLRGYSTFSSFVQAYSTTLQPVLNSVKAAQRAINYSRRNPRKYQYVETGGFYPGTRVPKGQLKHHRDRIQKMTWGSLRRETQDLVERALRGELPNPLGLASEFANTNAYFVQNNHRSPRSYEEWRNYTEAYARQKKWTWIGPKPGLNQVKQNAFFVDNRVKNLPSNTVQVLGPRP